MGKWVIDDAPYPGQVHWVEEILAERQKTHGDYTDHANITQALKMAMRRGEVLEEKWRWDLNSDQRETLEMIAHKIGRILAGDPNVEDHWRDIAGYATLSADLVRKRLVRSS